MKCQIAIISFLILALMPDSTLGKIAPVPIADIVEKSDLIIVVDIKETVPRKKDASNYVWDAHGIVQEVLKGKYTDQSVKIEFYISNKKPTPKRLAKGIRYILFLVKNEESHRMTNRYFGAYSMSYETQYYYENGGDPRNIKGKAISTYEFIEMIRRLVKQPNKSL